MDMNQFRKAVAILFPKAEFHFTERTFSRSAIGQGSSVGVNIFAKYDSDHITVQQMGENKAVHALEDIFNAN